MSLSRRQGSISSGRKRRRKIDTITKSRNQAKSIVHCSSFIVYLSLPGNRSVFTGRSSQAMPNDKCKMNNEQWKSLVESIARRGRRAFLRRLAELHYPDAGVDVIEKDVIAELSSAPGERQVRTEPLRVAGP